MKPNLTAKDILPFSTDPDKDLKQLRDGALAAFKIKKDGETYCALDAPFDAAWDAFFSDGRLEALRGKLSIEDARNIFRAVVPSVVQASPPLTPEEKGKRR